VGDLDLHTWHLKLHGSIAKASYSNLLVSDDTFSFGKGINVYVPYIAYDNSWGFNNCTWYPDSTVWNLQHCNWMGRGTDLTYDVDCWRWSPR
jgi:hypothetical protein